jgi:hypothetical protein
VLQRWLGAEKLFSEVTWSSQSKKENELELYHSNRSRVLRPFDKNLLELRRCALEAQSDAEERSLPKASNSAIGRDKVSVQEPLEQSD